MIVVGVGDEDVGPASLSKSAMIGWRGSPGAAVRTLSG